MTRSRRNPAKRYSYAKMRQDARRIFRAGINAVDPATIISRNISLARYSLRAGGRTFPLNRFERIFVLGAGKASAAMAAALEKILGPRISGGIVSVKYGHSVNLRRIRLQEAGHPIPDANGMQAARMMMDLFRRLTERDLVIFLTSGGGSALLPAPTDGITLEEKQKVTDLLLRCGADIKEINTIRKHVSSLKGGNLARAAFPATLITLILSDVIGDPLDAIAGGPTVPDPTTFADCAAVFDKYRLWNKVPRAVARYIREGLEGRRPETPKPEDFPAANVYNLVVGNNSLALDAARLEARRLGYRTVVLSSVIEGETREAARVHAAIAKEVLLSGNPAGAPACLLSGGETTVTLRGRGKGGRNQEFTLAAALEIAGWESIQVLSAGTDGTDGPTDAAGAFADGRTVSRADAMGLGARVFLEENNSYPFFKKLNDLFITGPTGTNVMDLRILLIQS